MKKIDPMRDYRYFSALIEDLHNILLRFHSLKLIRTFEQFDKVFSDFTLTETYRQYNKWPFAAIKIEYRAVHVHVAQADVPVRRLSAGQTDRAPQ